MKGRTLLFIIPCALVLFAAIGAYALDVLRQEMTPLEERVQSWAQRIEEVGGGAAYEELARSLDGEDMRSRHNQAHIFGAALYEALGVDGFPVCDERFGYGCLHEFLGHAVQKEGIQIVSLMNQKCIEPSSERFQQIACQHGIGHGILGSFGYSFQDLTSALRACKDIEHEYTLTSCSGGVFMEYNLRTTADMELREFDKSEPYAPCPALPAEHQATCIYSQPKWWSTVMMRTMSMRDVFRRLGELCVGFSDDAKLERSCVAGIGNSVSLNAQTGAEAIRLCEVASERADYRLLCRTAAANRFAFENQEEEVPNVCDGLSSEDFDHCSSLQPIETKI